MFMNKYDPRGLPRFHVQPLSPLHQSGPLADSIPARPTWIPTPAPSKRQMNLIAVKSRENEAAANEPEMLRLGRFVARRRTRLPVVPGGWKRDPWLLLRERDVGGFPNPSFSLSSLHGRWQLLSSFGGYGENESTQILKKQLCSQKGFERLRLESLTPVESNRSLRAPRLVRADGKE